MKSSKHSHIYDTRYDYPKTLQWEGKTGVGMTPTNLHYYSNKVYPINVTMFDHETWSTLWKVSPKAYSIVGESWVAL